MPLSENEQRILAEIEKHLVESDPRLAREVRRPRAMSANSGWWGALAILAGFGAMLVSLQIHPVLAFSGFLLMSAGALALERTLRTIARSTEPILPRASFAAFFRGSRAASGDSPSDD